MLRTILVASMALTIAPVLAAPAPPSAATAAPIKDDWVAIRNTMEINAPIEKVWSVIGGYCDMPRVINASCSYIRGTGGLGTVRLMGGDGEALKVGEGKYNYSFFYTSGSRSAAARYHGNLEIVPSIDNKTSTLVYTLIYDQSAFASIEERAAQQAAAGKSFERHFRPVKMLAEK